MASPPLNKEKTLQLEKVFQVPARLRVMSALMVRKKADFTELIDLLELTGGNLSMHIKTLNEYRYVRINKSFVNNKPKTTYEITSRGKKDFYLYVEMLKDILKPLKSV